MARSAPLSRAIVCALARRLASDTRERALCVIREAAELLCARFAQERGATDDAEEARDRQEVQRQDAGHDRKPRPSDAKATRSCRTRPRAAWSADGRVHACMLVCAHELI